MEAGKHNETQAFSLRRRAEMQGWEARTQLVCCGLNWDIFMKPPEFIRWPWFWQYIFQSVSTVSGRTAEAIKYLWSSVVWLSHSWMKTSSNQSVQSVEMEISWNALPRGRHSHFGRIYPAHTCTKRPSILEPRQHSIRRMFVWRFLRTNQICWRYTLRLQAHHKLQLLTPYFLISYSNFI